MCVRFFVLLLVVFLTASSADAHESRPGYLQLTLTGAETVNLLLKIPALGNMRLGLYPNLPANCEAEGTATSYHMAWISRSAYLSGIFGLVISRQYGPVGSRAVCAPCNY